MEFMKQTQNTSCLNISACSSSVECANDNSILNLTASSSDNNTSCSSMNGNGGINNNTSSSSSASSTTSSTNGSQSNIEINDSFNDFMSKTNLIVNYLPQNMAQDEIKTLFSNIGPLESCKLVKDKASAQSLGYAFVNFQKAEDASKAVNQLNGMRIQNKIIKVSFARPSSETIKGANLYICGLRLEVTQQELENIFAPFGLIISSKILTDPKTGASKGVGFVRFDQRHEAEVAIAKLNGSIPEGNTEPIIVKFANSPAMAKAVIGHPLAPCLPTVRGLYQPFRSSNACYRYSPMNTYYAADPNTLQLHTISTPLTTATGISLASVLAAQMPQATTPIPTINAAPSPSSLSGWCLFVYNLGPETDEQTLWRLFGPYGAVQSVKISRDNATTKCKGFGFVTMTNYEEAILAIKNLNGINLNNRILQVSFKTNANKMY